MQPYVIHHRKLGVLSIRWGNSPFLTNKHWQEPYLITSKRRAEKELRTFLTRKPELSHDDFDIYPVTIDYSTRPKPGSVRTREQMQDAAKQFLDGHLDGKEFLAKLTEAIAKSSESKNDPDTIPLAHLLSKGDPQ